MMQIMGNPLDRKYLDRAVENLGRCESCLSCGTESSNIRPSKGRMILVSFLDRIPLLR